jgi:hypothetical protein
MIARGSHDLSSSLTAAGSLDLSQRIPRFSAAFGGTISLAFAQMAKGRAGI